MSNCLRIQVFPDFDVPSHYKDTRGNIWLDLREDDRNFPLSKSISQLDVEDLKVDAFGPVEVPVTGKNRWLLNRFVDANISEEKKHMPCMIFIDSKVVYGIRLKAINYNPVSYTISVSYNSEHWSISAQRKYLTSLTTLGDILFGPEVIAGTWPNNVYNDGDDGIYFPVVDFGAWRDKGSFVLLPEDFRVFFHLLYLLQKGFREIGWCFRSSWLETEFGRKLIVYLLDNSYNEGENNKEFFQFSAEKHITTNTGIPLQVVTDWTELVDDSNSFNEVAGVYTKACETTFTVNVKIVSATTGLIAVALVKSDGSTETILDSASEQITLLGVQFTLTASTLILNGETVFVKMTSTTGQVTVIDLKFSNVVDAIYYTTGDTINLASILDKNLTLLDVLKGATHLIKGKIETDYESKTIWLRPPYSGKELSNGNPDIENPVQGFYTNEVVDIRHLQDCDSRQVEKKDFSAPRYKRIMFADSDDVAVKEARHESDPLYSKKVDFGEEYKEDEERDANPLFQPTITGTPSEGPLTYQNHSIARMIDNDNGDFSYNIGPRILIAHGYRALIDLNGDLMSWRYDFGTFIITEFQFPYATQLPARDFNAFPLTEKLIYGDDDKDLYSKWWGRDLMHERLGQVESHLINISSEQYWNRTLRERYLMLYDGHIAYARMETIDDYRSCDKVLTPVRLIPEIQYADPCFDPSGPDNNCEQNVPVIEYVYNENNDCYSFTLHGMLLCQLLEVQWEYRPLSSPTWISAGDNPVAIVCNQNEIFQVRALLTFVLDCPCPNVTPIVTVNPCINNPHCLISTFFQGGVQCFEFELIGEYGDGMLIVNYDNGGGQIPITAPYIVCDPLVGTLTFYWHFIPDNGCAEIQDSCSIDIPPPQPPPIEQCNQNLPVLVCIPEDIDGQTCYTWGLQGEMIEPYETFTVTWECADGNSGTWHPGDEAICCQGEIVAHAIVFFCNCPPVCTSDSSCEGGCVTPEFGQPEPIAVCS